MTSLPEGAARRCHHALNPLHSALYFAPEPAAELAPYGIEDSRAVYLAVRAAPLGPVGPGVVTATFYNFSHDMVARHLPHTWDLAGPERVLAARLRAADAMLRRLLGPHAAASPEMAEAARLALRAAEGCTRAGRPLYAANADLPVPQDPHLALWHAATLLREHRGDCHVAALQAAALDPVEALVSHTATGRGMSPRWVLGSRGHHTPDWTAAQQRLRERGLLDEAGGLTAAGAALREEVERATDAMDRGPYAHLGAEGVARLTELARHFSGAARAAGAFPAEAFGKG